jgi:hypothetical protein
VKYIYIGAPKETDKFGEAPRIQLNDALAVADDIPEFIVMQRSTLDEAEQDKMTISLKVDRDAKMGIVSDVRQELREANALKLNYSSIPTKISE